MRAEEIREGDVFIQDKNVSYTVVAVTAKPPHVTALVRYLDGGTSMRVYEIGKETPLTRPGAPA